MLRIHTAQSEGLDTEAVTLSVIQKIQTTLNGMRPCGGIVLASCDYDHATMLALLMNAFPDLELIGCTTPGDFSTEIGLSEDAINL